MTMSYWDAVREAGKGAVVRRTGAWWPEDRLIAPDPVLGLAEWTPFGEETYWPTERDRRVCDWEVTHRDPVR